MGIPTPYGPYASERPEPEPTQLFPALVAPQNTPPDAPQSTESDDTATIDKSSDTPLVSAWCAAQKLPAYVVGRWVWIQWEEKPEPETLALVKSVGFRWVNARKAWAHSCGHWSRKGHIDPRIKYGMVPVQDAD